MLVTWLFITTFKVVDRELGRFLTYGQTEIEDIRYKTELSNIGKNIAATGMGAVNAKIIQKLAEDNNIGEIYAKISILNTLGSTIGMAIGLVITARVPDHSMRLCLMPFFTAFRIYSYNKAVDELI